MLQLFPTATPEEVGIDSQWLMNFCKRLEEQQLPLHSALIMRHGKVCMETYYKPYTRDTLHRMFSVTKSFVSLGIGPVSYTHLDVYKRQPLSGRISNKSNPSAVKLDNLPGKIAAVTA